MSTVRDISYEVDGRQMVGRLGVPDQPGPRPAVLIAHEANGLDDFQRSRAAQLADLGYVAFALDYHGDGTPPDFADAQARTTELWADSDRMRALGQAGLDVLLSEPATDAGRLAAIGYCFGGALVLELGRSGADLKAIVGFHPGLRSPRPEDARNITGIVLICVGADDPYVTVDDRATFEAEMKEAGVDWRMQVYGGVAHTFTHPNADQAVLPGLRYDQRADTLSWRAMLELFDEAFA